MQTNGRMKALKIKVQSSNLLSPWADLAHNADGRDELVALLTEAPS